MFDRRLLRSTGAAVLLAGVVLAVFDRPARAAAPGSGLGSFSVVATAPGSQFTYDYPAAESHPEVEGEAPESVAQLQSGPEGYALSSVAWPGALAANAGTTSQLINLPVPSSTSSALNEPVRAEARTGSGQPTVTNDSYPGVGMTASATPGAVSADTTMAGTSGPVPRSGSGSSESRSTAAIVGANQVTATAYSVVQSIDLGAGLITIKSVTSTATASSSPTTSSASGSTVVSGLSVAGQPAYVDEHGVHLGQSGPGAPLNQVASEIAQQALGQAGVKIAVSEPITQRQGSDISYDAGNLVFYFAPPHDTNGDTFTATFGGASATASSSPGYSAESSNGLVVQSATGVVGPPAASISSSGPVSSGTPTSQVTAAPHSPAMESVPTSATTTGPSSGTALPAASTLGLPHGIPPIAPVLVILGGFLAMVGMRRLPDRVLEQPATSCNLGGEP